MSESIHFSNEGSSPRKSVVFDIQVSSLSIPVNNKKCTKSVQKTSHI